VVLHKVGKAGVVVADPARGVLKLTREEFCQRWTGYLLVLVPEQAARPAPAGSPPVGPWRRFPGLLAGNRSLLAEAFLCAPLLTVLGLAPSYFIQPLVDSVLPRREERLLNALGVGMLLVVAFRVLFAILRQYLLAHASRKVDLGLI